ncbi:MAG: biotin synthase BioB, partial [Candidatus Omnitrophica bacterium]|nr:biotin synthase BioB [Candidatus Omnitrophota bacterium]
HTNIARYPLKGKEEIVRAAKAAKKNGAEYFGIVTSGGRLSKKELKEIVFAVAEITKKVDINICASLGALGREELAALKQAGLSRYHHNIETSARFYAEVVSTHKFKERLNTIKAASAAGLEVCSGGIIGMGETWQDRIDMALLLKELGVSSIPINFLVPIKGTPFESLKPLSVNDAIRTIAIFRIILKDKIVKIAAGREAVLGDFQGLGFMAGANGMLIGGYLTIKGRKIQSDHRLIKEIETLWRR